MALKDTFYISHGSPMISIDDSIPTRHFLKSWKHEVFRERPKAILVISGHWDTKYPTVNIVNKNEIIYDFYNFPRVMYQLKYPAPAAPDLGMKVKQLLLDSGIKRVDEDKKRGLDHGAWVPLMLMYPEADIPVCQLSVQPHEDAVHHFRMGKALESLKEEGVLVMGSGSTTHNLREIGRWMHSKTIAPWASAFDSWLEDALLGGRYEDVNQYLERAPYAKMAHPWPDHFYPLHVAMGAAGESFKAKQIHHSWQVGCMSDASYQFATL